MPILDHGRDAPELSTSPSTSLVLTWTGGSIRTPSLTIASSIQSTVLTSLIYCGSVSVILPSVSVLVGMIWAAETETENELMPPVFGRRIIGSIEADEIREWAVDRFKSPSYFNSALGVIAPAFSWAVSQKMLADNPIERIERMKVKQNDEIDIYSVKEARKLIAEARKMDALTPFAIMLFAGVRPYEVAKLEWEDIRVESSGNVVIWIKPSIAKTRSVRIVHAREKLSHYLLQRIGKGCKGKVCPKNWKNVSAAVREKAGLKGRPDAARHSFASYAIGNGESLDAVREDMGHSRGSDMLFKHYRGLVSADDARDFWNIPL